jgi:hypothetical protein
MPGRKPVSADIDKSVTVEAVTATGDPALDGARADIARTRDEVALSVIELQRELARTTDWRSWVARKPVLSLSLAFGVGFVIGHRGHRRR